MLAVELASHEPGKPLAAVLAPANRVQPLEEVLAEPGGYQDAAVLAGPVAAGPVSVSHKIKNT